MDVPLISNPRVRTWRLGVTGIALAATLITAPWVAGANAVDVAPDAAVKAALLYNFAEFVEWPALPSSVPLVVCIVGSDGIAVALVQTVRGQNIGGHALEVWRPRDSSAWRICNVLFIAESEIGRSAAGLGEIRALPVLTVSDGQGFSQGRGIIELYIEGGRMRFAINVDAVQRSGLRLSSRLLGLAKVVRNDQVEAAPGDHPDR